jgi:hypothetical protein
MMAENPENPKDGLASIVDVKNFFEYENISKFRADWQKLSDVDKVQLRLGIGEGTLTY